MRIPLPITRQLRTWLRRRGYEIRALSEPTPLALQLSELDAGFRHIYENKLRVSNFDITEFSTYKIVEYLITRRIPGDFIECGVYRGRMVLMMAHTLLSLGVTDRTIYLYDTFQGMTRPTSDDYIGEHGDPASTFDKWQRGVRADGTNSYKLAPLDTVRETVFQIGYPRERFQFVPGDVLQTVRADRHDAIAFLRLDTDWYESTKHELETLYDRLVVGGVLVIDDYGRWRGSRRATDEFFARLGERAPLLVRTSGERVCVKVR